MLLPYLVILLYLFKVSVSTPCVESDYKQFFFDCDPITNTRNITIYLDTNCENIQVTDKNNVLSLLCTLPTYTVTCNTRCESGEIIRFDPKTMSTICQKCPKDTYSTGGNIWFTNNWSISKLKDFKAECYAIDYDGYKKNEDCTSIQISEDKSMLMSGGITGKQVKYYNQMIYHFKSKNPGRLIVTYKQDSVREHSYFNGDFKLYMDYDLIIHDNAPNSNWKTKFHDFEAGEHEMVFFYWYMKSSKANDFKYYIQSLEIVGVDDAAYECKQCINSIAPEGSESCVSCQSNYFFNPELKECVPCPEGQISIPILSDGYLKCFEKQPCTKYDEEISQVTECVNGKQKYTLTPIKNSFCKDIESIKREETVDCGNEAIKPVTCTNDGHMKLTVFKYNFKTTLLSSFFTWATGWKNNGVEWYTGIYLPELSNQVLTQTVHIESQFGYLSITYSLDLNTEETFTIQTLNENIEFTDVKVTETKVIRLPKGEQKVSFIYDKKSSTTKATNSVSISEIILYGTNLTSNYEMMKCPKGTISTPWCTECIKCKENEIPNQLQNQCIPCDNGVQQIVDGEYKCINCPSYTFYDSPNCKLNEIIHQKDEKLKFNLQPFKTWLNRLCNEQSGWWCYDNIFIGPISNKAFTTLLSNQTNEVSIGFDLFFISIFEPSTIDLFDYTYDSIDNIIKEGHIFGLFSVKKPSINITDTNDNWFVEHNITYQNIKLKRNIAKSIKQIHLLGKSISVNKRMGLVMEFNEGDTCIADQTKKYKSFIYLKCNKFEFSSPHWTNIKDKGCTFVFEWNSPYLCKNCLTKEINHFEKASCKGGKREIIFDSDDECLIFNGTNPELIGYEKEFSDPLIQERDHIYSLILDGLPNKNSNDKGNRIWNTIVDVSEDNNYFDFDYIESKVYYQNCSIFENIGGDWKKYLLIIPVLYVITFFLVIWYCCKYRMVKNNYEKLRTSEASNIETHVGNDNHYGDIKWNSSNTEKKKSEKDVKNV